MSFKLSQLDFCLFGCFLEIRLLNIALWVYLLTQTKEQKKGDENETDHKKRTDRLKAKEGESSRHRTGSLNLQCINQQEVPET
jgi:hypothetical protein